MPGPTNVWAAATATSVADGGATETVMLTTNPIMVDTVQRRVKIVGLIIETPGTSGASITIKIRRGTTTSGTLVETIGPVFATAAQASAIPIVAEDTPGESHGLQYVITATIGSAGADGSAELVTAFVVTSS